MFKYKKNSLQVEILFSSGTCFGKVYPLSSLCFWHFFFVRNQFLCAYTISSRFPIMLHCSLCWSICPVYDVLDRKVLWYIEIRYCDVIRFFPLLKIVLAIWSILWFHVSFLGCFNDVSRHWYFDLDCSEFANCWGGRNTVIAMLPPIREHSNLSIIVYMGLQFPLSLFHGFQHKFISMYIIDFVALMNGITLLSYSQEACD